MTIRITPEHLQRVQRESFDQVERIIREKYPDIDDYDIVHGFPRRHWWSRKRR